MYKGSFQKCTCGDFPFRTGNQVLCQLAYAFLKKKKNLFRTFSKMKKYPKM